MNNRFQIYSDKFFPDRDALQSRQGRLLLNAIDKWFGIVHLDYIDHSLTDIAHNIVYEAYNGTQSPWSTSSYGDRDIRNEKEIASLLIHKPSNTYIGLVCLEDDTNLDETARINEFCISKPALKRRWDNFSLYHEYYDYLDEEKALLPCMKLLLLQAAFDRSIIAEFYNWTACVEPSFSRLLKDFGILSGSFSKVAQKDQENIEYCVSLLKATEELKETEPAIYTVITKDGELEETLKKKLSSRIM